MLAIAAVDRREADALWPAAAGLPAAARILAAREGQRTTGWVALTVRDHAAAVVALEAEDTVLGEGLLRAALNEAQRAGAREASVSADVCGDLPARLGLERQGDMWTGEIAAVFARRCCGT